MKNGTNIFCIIYNILGFLGANACVSSAFSVYRSRSLVIGEMDIVQIITYIIAVLFFSSSFLLKQGKKEGFLIPILLLVFFICGGFIVLIPLLAGHILFFTRPNIKMHFI